MVTGDNYFGDRIVFEDFLYGIDCSKDGIAIHLLALISKVIIDKADRAQPQAGVIKKLFKGIDTTLTNGVRRREQTEAIRKRIRYLSIE